MYSSVTFHMPANHSSLYRQATAGRRYTTFLLQGRRDSRLVPVRIFCADKNVRLVSTRSEKIRYSSVWVKLLTVSSVKCTLRECRTLSSDLRWLSFCWSGQFGLDHRSVNMYYAVDLKYFLACNVGLGLIVIYWHFHDSYFQSPLPANDMCRPGHV